MKLTRFLEMVKDKYDIDDAYDLKVTIETGTAQNGDRLDSKERLHLLQKLCECVYNGKQVIDLLSAIVEDF